MINTIRQNGKFGSVRNMIDMNVSQHQRTPKVPNRST